MVRDTGFEPAPSVELSGNLEGNTQGDAQNAVVLGRDLSQVVTAWAKLPTALKAAILSIVGSVTSSEVEP
jgi:hypothetical protein